MQSVIDRVLHIIYTLCSVFIMKQTLRERGAVP